MADIVLCIPRAADAAPSSPSLPSLPYMVLFAALPYVLVFAAPLAALLGAPAAVHFSLAALVYALLLIRAFIARKRPLVAGNASKDAPRGRPSPRPKPRGHSVEIIQRAIAYFSHQTRNPLHSVRAAFIVLRHAVRATADTNAALRAALADAELGIQQLTLLVSDMVDFEGLSRGEVRLQPQATNLGAFAAQACRLFSGYIKPSVDFVMSAGLAQHVVVLDRRRLMQIVAAGLSNAGKFTQEGRVAMHLMLLRDARATASGATLLFVDITNTGSGLKRTPEEVEALFVPFRNREEESLTSRSACDSEVAAEEAEEETDAETRAEQIRSSTRRSFFGNFAAHKERSTHFGALLESVLHLLVPTMVEAPRGSETPALVTPRGLGLYLARMMAVAMDGWLHLWDDVHGVTHFSLFVSASPTIGPRIPQSLSGLDDDVGLAFRAAEAAEATAPPSQVGADETKSEEAVLASAPTPVVWQALRVAVVDDDEFNIRFCRMHLAKLGVQEDHIHSFASGQEAIDFFATPKPPVDVCLLDREMEGKSGLDVMRESRPPFPVVAMTGSVDRKSVEEYRAVNMRGALSKPFSDRSLKAAILYAMDPTKPFFLVGLHYEG